MEIGALPCPGIELPHGGGIARAQRRISRVGADIVRDAPGPGALCTCGELWHNGDAFDFIEHECIGGHFSGLDNRTARDCDLGPIHALRGCRQGLVADIYFRRGFKARPDALLTAFDLKRARNHAPDGPDFLPFRAQRFVAPIRRDFRKGPQVNRTVLDLAMTREPGLFRGKA